MRERPESGRFYFGILPATVAIALALMAALTLYDLTRTSEKEASSSLGRAPSARPSLGPSAQKTVLAAKVPHEDARERVTKSPDRAAIAALLESAGGETAATELALDPRLPSEARVQVLAYLEEKRPDLATSIATRVLAESAPPESLLLFTYELLARSGRRELLLECPEGVVESAQLASRRRVLIGDTGKNSSR